MKKLRFTAIIAAFTMLAGALAGCGGSGTSDPVGEVMGGNPSKDDTSASGDGTLTGTVTLKEYLDAEPRVGFLVPNESGPDKNRLPLIFLFEDGIVYQVYPSTDEKGYLQSNRYSGKSGLTWGDIANMTDEELLEFARAYKTLEWGREYDKSRYPTGEYKLHIYTDSTGNLLEYECIDVEQERAKEDNNWEWYSDINIHFDHRFVSVTEATIYDSTFSGIKTKTDSYGEFYGLYFRTGENLKITFDYVGEEGVEID